MPSLLSFPSSPWLRPLDQLSIHRMAGVERESMGSRLRLDRPALLCAWSLEGSVHQPILAELRHGNDVGWRDCRRGRIRHRPRAKWTG